jgi:hypothetical protein
MKKSVFMILLICVLVFSMVACNPEAPIESDQITTESSTETFSKVEVTIDSISELFEADYSAQEYTPDVIAQILPNLENVGIILNGDVTTIIHMCARNSAPGMDDWSWAYVYEFTDEADAIAFEENRRAFVEATEENGACVRFGLIVVFGSASVISSIVQ